MGADQTVQQGEINQLIFNRECSNMKHQQVYHIKALPKPPPGGLDLNIADDDEFSPDKLRATLERLYMTVIIGFMSFGNFIARLRSWREPRRTGIACAIYSLAWLIGCLVPLFMLLLIVLILFPRSRSILFPPAPIALVNNKTGGIQKPKAGVLGSHDTATGAPEKHRGEAAEQEASNFVNQIASVTLAGASGKHDQGDPTSSKSESKMPDPSKMVESTTGSKVSAEGGKASEEHDKTKKPMEANMWAKMKPAMHALEDVSDTWERFANALSPTPPFSHTTQYQLAGIVAPTFLMSLFIKPALVVHCSTLLFGFLFFSDPLQQRAIRLIAEKVPNWPEYIQLRNSFLKGVPTNAQLTITLLRIGEANRAPLPPPPSSDEPPAEEAAELDKKALTDGGLDASHDEIHDAVTSDAGGDGVGKGDGDADKSSTKSKPGKGATLLSVVKSTASTGINTKLGAIDRARAKLGSHAAKEKLGVVPSGNGEEGKQSRSGGDGFQDQGPVEFRCRYRGIKGAIYLDSSVSPASPSSESQQQHHQEQQPASSPCIFFSTRLSSTTGGKDSDQNPDNNVSAADIPLSTRLWSISIADITEVKKVGGLSWKGKLIVGLITDRTIRDGIEFVVGDNNNSHHHDGHDRDDNDDDNDDENDDETEVDGNGDDDDGDNNDGSEQKQKQKKKKKKKKQRWKVTALRQRNELFNRVVAIGGQAWESL